MILGIVFRGILWYWIFQVNGASMYPALPDKQKIIISSKINALERWDIVVIQLGKNYYAKRVIGLPWEVLQIEDGGVSIMSKIDTEAQLLVENYLVPENKETLIRGSRELENFNIPDNNYFLLWDNRSHSTDSRTCFRICREGSSHYISMDQIIWKLVWKL